MRTQHALVGCLILAALALLAVPTTAAVTGASCKPAYADMETSVVVDEAIEVGWVKGLLDGSVYLKYDDLGPPIDPKNDPPNLVFSAKNGELRLWAHGESTPEKDGWYRLFKIVAYEGSGDFAGATVDLWMYGYFMTDKGGYYELEGTVCLVPTKLPLRRR